MSLKKAKKKSSSEEEENLKASNGDENIYNDKDNNDNFNESIKFKILQQNIKKESNNFLHLQDHKIIDKDNLDRKNSSFENLRKNFNSSNIFENISEISKKGDNYIDRGVKTSIFESEINKNSKSQLNDKEINFKTPNRLLNNNFDLKKKNKNFIDSNSNINLSSKIYLSFYLIFYIFV